MTAVDTARVKPVKPVKPRRRPGRPRADEPQGEGLREAVISATEQVYGSHGYRGSSVELIAQAAGISRPLFYRLFKDRREVIDIVVVRANDALQASVLAAIQPKTSLITMLLAAIDAYFAWCRSHALIAGSIYRELHDLDSPASIHRARVFEELGQLLRLKAQERGTQTLPRMMHDTLMCAIEHVGSRSFWPEPVSPQELALNRAIIERIVLASVASADEQALVPGLDTLLDDGRHERSSV